MQILPCHLSALNLSKSPNSHALEACFSNVGVHTLDALILSMVRFCRETNLSSITQISGSTRLKSRSSAATDYDFNHYLNIAL